MEKLEIERKFLIDPPFSWVELLALFDSLASVKQITQHYLSEPGEEIFRLRKTLVKLDIYSHHTTIYHFNKKTRVSDGIHKEFEKEISEAEYSKFLGDSKYDKCFLEKTRIVLRHKGLVFELDIFKSKLTGLVMLEVELPDIDCPIDFPTCLPLQKEVTRDKRYSNLSLAYHGLPEE
jgi:CYTH domain-containing protein